jgi:hypothetical protein
MKNMGTTNLFVELVVIGVGALLWVLLLAGAALGFNPALANHLVKGDNLLIPVLAVTYLFGILTDRMADILFETLWAKRLCHVEFPSKDAYHEARIRVIAKSERLAERLEYGRSRMRICRGWTLNSALIGVSLNLFVWSQLADQRFASRLALAGTLFSGMTALTSWFAWRRLAATEYKKTREQDTYFSAQNKDPHNPISAAENLPGD